MATAENTRGTAGGRGARSMAQNFALIFGAVYLLVGLAGFLVTGFDGFAAKSYKEILIIFPLNPLHNIVHLLIGGAWLAASARHDTAKTANLVIGAAYGLVFILGLLGVLKFLAIEDASSTDNYLHLGSAALALYFGTAGAGTATGTREAATR